MLENVAHRASLSVDLSMHANRAFSGRSVVHMPYYLLVLLHVARPLHVGGGGGWGEGTVTWGRFPRGCEGTVAPRCFLYKGGGVQ